MNLFEYLNARAQRNSQIDLLIGRTQRSISTGTLWVIAGVLAALLFLEGVDAVVKDLLLLVLGALLGGWASQNQFWFGRPRGAGVPDPSLTEIKTTETKTTETTTAPLTPPNKTEGES
jgi:hypothetical protein